MQRSASPSGDSFVLTMQRGSRLAETASVLGHYASAHNTGTAKTSWFNPITSRTLFFRRMENVGVLIVNKFGHTDSIVFFLDLMAYCPDREKGESAYVLAYGTGTQIANLQVLGRNSNQSCCDTHYTPADESFVPSQCVEPALTFGAFFPESPDVDEDSDDVKLSPGGTN